MAITPQSVEALMALPPESLLTTSQAAIFLTISESTLARMRKDGIGPAYVKDDGANGAIHYSKQDLQDWMAAVKTGGKVR